jgi:hypothetical protein
VPVNVSYEKRFRVPSKQPIAVGRRHDLTFLAAATIDCRKCPGFVVVARGGGRIQTCIFDSVRGAANAFPVKLRPHTKRSRRASFPAAGLLCQEPPSPQTQRRLFVRWWDWRQINLCWSSGPTPRTDSDGRLGCLDAALFVVLPAARRFLRREGKRGSAAQALTVHAYCKH